MELTKLEELEAAYWTAWDAYWVARDAGHGVAAWTVVEHAYVAYKAELKKTHKG